VPSYSSACTTEQITGTYVSDEVHDLVTLLVGVLDVCLPSVITVTYDHGGACSGDSAGKG
jgi:hypothetical protein